jgi:hypothetical protein
MHRRWRTRPNSDESVPYPCPMSDPT